MQGRGRSGPGLKWIRRAIEARACCRSNERVASRGFFEVVWEAVVVAAQLRARRADNGAEAGRRAPHALAWYCNVCSEVKLRSAWPGLPLVW